jgi:predicted RNA-binding protein with PIN domain
MSYLIDGNNVMAQQVGWHRDKARARRLLLDDLARFAAKKRVRLRVVFDGAPDPSFGDGSKYKGVVVYYAKRGSDADERIKEFVEADRERQTLIVVTSDRKLADYVHRCGAKVVSSGAFRKRMEELDHVGEVDETASGAKVQEPDQGWMRFFGVSPEDDD